MATPSAINVCRFTAWSPAVEGYANNNLFRPIHRGEKQRRPCRGTAAQRSAIRGDRIVDAASGVVHGVANGIGKTKSRQSDDRADNGENQGIFSSRGTAVVAKYVDESFHCPSPYCCDPPVPVGTNEICRAPGEAEADFN